MLRLACLSLVLACGCAATDMQASYVRSMEATHEAITADVKAGLYAPDATSRQTLDQWQRANAEARRVLEEEGRWE